MMEGQRDRDPTNGQAGGSTRDATPGLESHLRNLILTNTTPNGGGTSDYSPGVATSNHHPSPSWERGPISHHQRPNFPNANYASQGGSEAPASPSSGQALPSSPKTSRRRPNQAQRRQMNAQLTILPDVRPQPPFQAYQSYQPRPAPHYQRHMATNSHPSFSPSWSGASDAQRSLQTWRRPSQPGLHSVATYPIPPANPYPHSMTIPNGGVARQHPPATSQNQPRPFMRPDEISHQAAYLEMLCHQVVPRSEIERQEIAEKEAFRQRIESISREVVARHELAQNTSSTFPVSSVELKCFGSLSSGFATKDSDMDLGLLSPLSKVQPDAPESPIPRLLEKALLDAGLGARLLSRTRVPIIKLCESPPEKLRQGLLEARAKWENGLDNERPDDVEDEQRHDSPGPGDDDDHQDVSSTGANDVTSPTEFQIPCRTTGEVQIFRLQQGPKNPLSSYFTLAKRILRRAGGRDVTVMNERQFSDVDWAILQKVCQAFIRGLLDPRMREHMTASISQDHDWNSRYHRSLAGLFTQIEGEKILQSWHEWPERNLFTMSLQQDERELSLWETQSRSMTDAQPFQHYVNLQADLEKIKKISSMKLLLLEQGEDETPSQYYIRTQVVIKSLEFDPNLRPQMQQEIVRRYVSGIYQEDIRCAVSKYLQDFPDHSDFQAVGCRHKSLHLARELERALNENLYCEKTAASVEQYVNLLLSPLVRASKGFVVAIPPASSPLIATIKTIEDPHGMSPNQPRDKYRDPLEFPKKGLGAQCDINFSAHLALQNTTLLRCYAHTDPRVKPMVLFVKQWAKVRGINSGYRGTLSSYGYVLMVLHYLVNIAQPFVCPNLQLLAPKTQPNVSQAEMEATITCRGYNVQFWRNEQDIIQFALSNQLNNNKESVGDLLRGFFEYYAQNGAMSSVPKRGFDWGRDVISLRTQGGLLTKQEKGWTVAKTVYGAQKSNLDGGQSGGGKHSASRNGSGGVDANDNIDHQQHPYHHHRNQSKSDQSAGKNEQVREIRLRYLFAIEDPFEVDHNVARTVTHNGIVSIRDEFRRAWRLIRAAGNGNLTEDLLQDINDVSKSSSGFLPLLEDIHGPAMEAK